MFCYVYTYLFTRYFTLWNTCDYRRSGSLWDSRAAGRHKGLFLWGCTMFSCSTLLLLFQNRQHCRLSICIFVNRFEANPNNNLMMRRAGLSIPNHCANEHTPGKLSHYDFYYDDRWTDLWGLRCTMLSCGTSFLLDSLCKTYNRTYTHVLMCHPFSIKGRVS